MSLLEVNGLNRYYGDSHILFDVSLHVEKMRSSHCWGATVQASPPRSKA
ncbi:MAG: hypothetical protein K2Q97_08390 [Burkholderiaceae bacterium]|nr:hypothetical protein [Burkholderiaceae bacterium]